MSESANAYRTVVVGTDGSESSLRAVARAGALAGACGATLVIACAYLPTEADDRELARAQDVLRDEAYQVVGSHPAEDTVRTAAERAGAAGADGRADRRRPGLAGRDAAGRRPPRGGRPARGRQPRAGRHQGPAARLGAGRRDPPLECDVLVVHTTG